MLTLVIPFSFLGRARWPTYSTSDQDPHSALPVSAIGLEPTSAPYLSTSMCRQVAYQILANNVIHLVS